MPENNYNTTHDKSEESGMQLDLSSVIRDLLKSWWLIIFFGITTACLFGSYKNLTYQPLYQTKSTFFVGKNGVNTSFASRNYSFASSLTDNMTTIIHSDILSTKICERLGRNSLDAAIEVSTVPSTNLMSVSVTASNPKEAYDILNNAIEIGLDICRQMDDQIMVMTLAAPVIPMEPFNPLSVYKSMLKMGLLGAVLMGALVVLLSYFRDTLKNEKDFRHKVDAHLLGTIYHENRNKTIHSLLNRKFFSMAITNPSLSFGFTETNRMLATNIYLEMQKKNAKSLFITSVTENEGKSTVAANIAIAMAEEGHKVCLVDCDFRKPAQYKIFEVDTTDLKKNDLVHMIQNDTKIRLRSIDNIPNLFTLFTIQSQNQLLNPSSRDRLSRLLQRLNTMMDVVIVDSAPWGLVADGLTIASLTDTSILVVEQDNVDIQSVNDTLDQIRDTENKMLGCIFNNVYSTVSGRGHYGYGSYYGYGNYYGKYYNRYSNTESHPAKKERKH